MNSTLLGVRPKAELADDSRVRGIDGREVVIEADNTDTRYELDGDWHGVEAQGR